MTKVIWTELADFELEEVLNRIEFKWGSKVKEEFLDTLEDCINQINEDIVHHIFVNKELNIQKCLVTRHNTLLFIKTKTTITILRFFANKRKPE